MLERLISFIKKNALLLFIGLIALFPYFNNLTSSISANKYSSDVVSYVPSEGISGEMGFSPSAKRLSDTGSDMPVPIPQNIPHPDAIDRKTATDANMSLLVKDVKSTMDEIKNETSVKKGYVVNSSISRPEEGATGHISVRIPTSELENFMQFARSKSVKVVYENTYGRDITDQYMDAEARLEVLNELKTQFMSIMTSANTSDEMLRVQKQIFDIQSQIDSLKGQLQYMDGISSTSLVTMNLSTDELSLPYAPDKAWRPEVVFKQAVRALLGTLRGVGNAFIWIGVYSIIWIPAILVFIIVRTLLRRRAYK